MRSTDRGILPAGKVGPIGIAASFAATFFALASPATAQSCALPPITVQSERLAAADLHPADLAAVNRDLKAIRDAGEALVANGQDAACSALADALQAIIANPKAGEDAARAAYASATPLDGPETVAVGDLLGMDLIGLSGRPAAKVEDVWLEGPAEESLVLVSLSGILARDGRFMAVPLDAIRLAADGRYLLGLTTNDIAAAPRLQDRETPPTADWRATNVTFYDTTLADLGGVPSPVGATPPATP